MELGKYISNYNLTNLIQNYTRKTLPSFGAVGKKNILVNKGQLTLGFRYKHRETISQSPLCSK